MAGAPYIEWRPEFSVGVAAIDHEHVELVSLINDLHARLDAGEREAVAAFLGEVYARISAHFALEEKQMRDRGYDQYAAHKADHERLLDDIVGIIDGWEEQGRYGDAEFAQLLCDWFTVHFGSHDARLHQRLS